MIRAFGRGWRWLIVTATLALILGLVAGSIARDQAREALEQSAQSDATLRASLLDSEVARFRMLPLALRDDSDVVAVLAGRPGAREALNLKLEELARTTGAPVIYVIDSEGVAVATSNWRGRDSFMGSNFRFRRYFTDAQRDGSGTQFALGIVSGRPGLFFAQRTAAGGVVVIKLEFDRIEANWAQAGGETFVRDADGVVVVSSRPEWRFATTHPLTSDRIAAFRRDASAPSTALQPLPVQPGSMEGSVLTAQPGWTLTLRHSARADRSAGRAAGLGAVLGVVTLSALGWGLRQRSEVNRRRTQELEEAVRARTAELTREMAERAETEAHAADLREGLRQANRLATLGQVTASVAHETAQPVAAIRNYAATSAQFLERGDSAAVLSNLAAIERLADRIGAVTYELRGFSRRRTGQIRDVRLADIIDGALLILKEQLRAVTLRRPVLHPDLFVRGGQVRLEQVIVNILQNALEALRDQADARIDIALRREEEFLILAVADNGPGIDPVVAPRLFTPFATSRAEGVGLGLVIAHDIMIEFGGTLRDVPAENGATFEIVMVAA